MLVPADGPRRVLTFVILTICSDIGGYFAGITLGRGGRHPMAPAISPKKTWEGFAGSVVACLIGGALCLTLLLHGHAWQGVLTGAAAVLAAIVGDLVESMIKRDLDIKDMGTLLPGHGGILERLDSLLVAAPVVWLLLFVFIPVRLVLFARIPGSFLTIGVTSLRIRLAGPRLYSPPEPRPGDPQSPSGRTRLPDHPAALLRREPADQGGRAAFLGQLPVPFRDRDDPEPAHRIPAEGETRQVRRLAARPATPGESSSSTASGPAAERERRGLVVPADAVARARTRSRRATGRSPATGTPGPPARSAAWWPAPARSGRSRSGRPAPAPPPASAGSSCPPWTAPCRAAGPGGRSVTPISGCLPAEASQ